eukprot:GILJ01010403.1.p1 GENE.GILJ01010403.1~~GILJ01010403.1.p1  ORF type:complete len:302 (-),score=63.54 GILJ01010403.1:123-1028(-)
MAEEENPFSFTNFVGRKKPSPTVVTITSAAKSNEVIDPLMNTAVGTTRSVSPSPAGARAKKDTTGSEEDGNAEENPFSFFKFSKKPETTAPTGPIPSVQPVSTRSPAPMRPAADGIDSVSTGTNNKLVNGGSSTTTAHLAALEAEVAKLKEALAVAEAESQRQKKRADKAEESLLKFKANEKAETEALNLAFQKIEENLVVEKRRADEAEKMVAALVAAQNAAAGKASRSPEEISKMEKKMQVSEQRVLMARKLRKDAATMLLHICEKAEAEAAFMHTAAQQVRQYSIQLASDTEEIYEYS